ncbi:putative xylanase/chitin deacetylase [Sphaerochaeta pleomorpha str. Grapes]|uniref:Putative xylanase/chitin deacetylase n=1 Tax=Sphaerochaeta pleomorpha (strain ATCC BAA-1885 / DSM 22778 / Grapes) TaxID=158190 RepID=G8QSG3_SPHPG|nr:polysaccharide deacetylase family protein [Sphaerochaeta pleomorpha]AEV30093.1 putative xylanase/chitin deacetylase [Sphaerochaeta pleomorpha str. Grapes]
MTYIHSHRNKIGILLIIGLLIAFKAFATNSTYAEEKPAALNPVTISSIRYWKPTTNSEISVRTIDPNQLQTTAPVRANPKLLVVMYHNIVYGRTGNIYNRDLYNFEHDLIVLKRNYSVTDFSELIDNMGKGTLKTDQAVITFDDGDLSMYGIVFPLLKEYKTKATFFLVPNFIGTVGYMSWEQIREMANYRDVNGKRLFFFGSHSLTHRPLGDLTSSEIQRELSESKRIIEQETGYPTEALALPFGSGAGDKEIIDIAKKVGFTVIRTSRPVATLLSSLDLMQIGGFNVENYSTDVFTQNMLKLSGR